MVLKLFFLIFLSSIAAFAFEGVELFSSSKILVNRYNKYSFKGHGSRADVCTEEGPMCDGCNEVVYCRENFNGEFEKDPLETCKADETCLKAKCTTEPNPACESPDTDYKFICIRPGIFPDPLSGVSYHICKTDDDGNLEEDSMKRDCENSCYDPLTTYCSVSLSDEGTCPGPVQACKSSGPLPVTGNPQLYALCIADSQGKIYPQIRVCNFDYVFNAKTNRCEALNVDSGVDSVTGICNKAGNFKDESDCNKYLYCSRPDVLPISRACSATQYFNSTVGRCTSYTCQNV